MPKLAIFFSAVLCVMPVLTYAGTSNLPNEQWQGAVVYSMFKTMGSGVPVSKCHVLTNEHVIRGSNRASVFIEGERYKARVVSLENDNDLALLKIQDCPIEHFAKLSKVPPQTGDLLTSVYYKPGFNLFKRMTKTRGIFKGSRQVTTIEDKSMASMIIDDPYPRQRSSGGGVSSKHGLVSVIFGIALKHAKPTTYAVSYDALKGFLRRNKL